MTTGIYIHIPFCRAKCGYCGFVSQPLDDSLAQRYQRAVVRELERFAGASRCRAEVGTIYFGGGTPSVIPPGHLAAMLLACRCAFDVRPDCEISMEANPGTVSPEKLLAYRSMGFNRISLGAQSFAREELEIIGRSHDVAQIGESCRWLRAAGFENFSLDLILGLPGQTESGWHESLRRAAELGPEHLSFYMLELEGKVPLAAAVAAGKCGLPEEDEVADWYLQGIEILEGRGYGQYEISNFARPGCACRHNLKYWRLEPVLGFGVAAHSFDGEFRYANEPCLTEYLGAVEGGRSPVSRREPIDATRALEETIVLGLRLREGLDWNRVLAHGDREAVVACESALVEMRDLGLVERHADRVRLSKRGLLLSNEVFQRFIQLGGRGM
jgi:oxygen-independent coproporphyrinogen III oxidase